jgi:hypothetical protein
MKRSRSRIISDIVFAVADELGLCTEESLAQVRRAVWRAYRDGSGLRAVRHTAVQDKSTTVKTEAT